MSYSLLCRRRAVFGKRRAVDDYEWDGADRIAKSLTSWGPLLPNYSDSARKHVALVGRFDDCVWLACTSIGGYDRTGRTVLQVEVLRCDGEEDALVPRRWPAIAESAIERASNSAVESYDEDFELTVEETAAKTALPDLDNAICATLGIAQVLDHLPATAILTWAPERYAGVLVIQSQLANGMVQRAHLGSTLTLGIGFGPLALNQEERALLEQCRAFSPSTSDLQSLLAFAPATVRSAVAWASGNESLLPSEVRLGGSAALETLLRWATHKLPAAELIRVVRDDLKLDSLPESITLHSWGLSAAAASAVLGPTEFALAPTSVVEELCRAGLLDNDTLFPLRSWAHHVDGSPALLALARAQLERTGLTAYADLLLDRIAVRRETFALLTEASAAAGSAVKS